MSLEHLIVSNRKKVLKNKDTSGDREARSNGLPLAKLGKLEKKIKLLMVTMHYNW